MGQDELLRLELARLYREYTALKIPRGGSLVDLRGADVDLYEEDSYLAGLVSTFLSRGGLSVETIELDMTIDARLRGASGKGPNAKTLESFRTYRMKMRELANLLSIASGIRLAS